MSPQSRDVSDTLGCPNLSHLVAKVPGHKRPLSLRMSRIVPHLRHWWPKTQVTNVPSVPGCLRYPRMSQLVPLSGQSPRSQTSPQSQDVLDISGYPDLSHLRHWWPKSQVTNVPSVPGCLRMSRIVPHLRHWWPKTQVTNVPSVSGCLGYFRMSRIVPHLRHWWPKSQVTNVPLVPGYLG